MKIAVVYWSSTGNTEAMAQAVVEGAKHAGAEAELFTAAEFDGGKMDEVLKDVCAIQIEEIGLGGIFAIWHPFVQ